MLAFLNTFQVLLQGERATLGLSLGFVKLVKLQHLLETLEGMIRLSIEKSGLL